MHARNKGRFQALEDAMLVHTTLENKAAEPTKEPTKLIAAHAEFVRWHEEWIKHSEVKLARISHTPANQRPRFDA
jgi:hypothetical protein